jgi:hypothetical protein
MFLDCVIGRRGMTIQLPPSSLAKNIILTSMCVDAPEQAIDAIAAGAYCLKGGADTPPDAVYSADCYTISGISSLFAHVLAATMTVRFINSFEAVYGTWRMLDTDNLSSEI